MIDFRHLPTHCKYIALMPQWDFLNFLAEHGKRYKTFDLHMKTEATDLIEEGGRIVGLRAKGPDGMLTIRADLVVGCDGRHSTVREKSGLQSDDYGAPMDVLWFRMSRKQNDTTDTFGHVEAGRMMIMLDRGDYWQCAYVIPKGGIEKVQSEGLEAFRKRVTDMSPFLADRIGELKSWDDIKLLSVSVDRLQRWWRPGSDLHRRCCPRDVADRRRRHQYGGAGRGGCGQSARRAAQERHDDDRGPSCHSEAAHLAGAFHPVASAHHPEARSSAVCSGWKVSSGRSRRCSSSCSTSFRRCAAFRRGCLGSVSAPSTCARRRFRNLRALSGLAQKFLRIHRTMAHVDLA